MNDAGNNPEFDDIFDECMRDVLRNSRSIDDCVAQYPQYAAELRPALQVGLLTARLKAPQMPASSVANLEMHLRAQMAAPLAEAKVIRPSRTFWLPISRAAAMFLIVFLATLGSGAGAVAASSNAVPGDWLYGLKRLWEAIILALTPLTGQEDDIYLTIAEHRLDEVEELSQRGALTNAALLDLYSAAAQAIASADAQTAVEVTAFLQEMSAHIAPVLPAITDDSLRFDLLTMTTPIPLDNGRLQAPASTPPSLVEETVEPTSSPTSTNTVTATITASVTATPTEAFTPTQTSTPTPRVPATATRTPTATVSPTASVTPSITPTHTWTPLPLPTLPQQSTLPPTERPSQNNGGSTNNGSTTPDEEATIRVRETDQAVYLTQTAAPEPTMSTP